MLRQMSAAEPGTDYDYDVGPKNGRTDSEPPVTYGCMILLSPFSFLLPSPTDSSLLFLFSIHLLAHPPRVPKVLLRLNAINFQP